jgi:hypothetical protein
MSHLIQPGPTFGYLLRNVPFSIFPVVSDALHESVLEFDWFIFLSVVSYNHFFIYTLDRSFEICFGKALYVQSALN